MTQHASSSTPPPPGLEPTHAERVRTLLTEERVGTLATQSAKHPGFPFASVMPYALLEDASPLFLISGMAIHTQNALADPRASLLVMQSGSGSDPLGAPRATLLGQVTRIEATDAIRNVYLDRHPSAKYWIDFSDFAFYRLDVSDIYFVGGFGVMGWVDAVDYRAAEPDPLAPFAAGILEHMNADHGEALRYITRFYAGLDAEEATMVSCDRLGFVVRARTAEGMKGARIQFAEPVTSRDEARRVLVAMSRTARVATFLAHIGNGELDDVRTMLAASPALVNGIGPHPFWGGNPQPLHVAIEGGRGELFDLLLENGADVNGSNEAYDLWSPLMLAINRDRTEMRDELLRRGANVGLLEALMLADDARVEELLRDGELPAIAPNAGSILAFARTPFAIDRLIALGADTQMKDRWGSSPIDAMSRLGKRGQPLLRHLIAHGVPAGPKEYARLGDLETLAKDPSAARLDSVMMGAVDFGHHALVEWLLTHGGNPNARAEAQSRQTALHSAAWNGDLAMVRLLLAAGADPAARDEQYDGTPLGWAETSLVVSNNPKCAEVAAFLKGV